MTSVISRSNYFFPWLHFTKQRHLTWSETLHGSFRRISFFIWALLVILYQIHSKTSFSIFTSRLKNHQVSKWSPNLLANHPHLTLSLYLCRYSRLVHRFSSNMHSPEEGTWMLLMTKKEVSYFHRNIWLFCGCVLTVYHPPPASVCLCLV
jgi:hypothetical protein